MRVLPTVLAVTLAAAAPAQAASPWSRPVDASPADDARAPLIAFDADGRSLLAYGTTEGGLPRTRVVTQAGERRLRGAPTELVQSGDRTFVLVRRHGSQVLLSRLRPDGTGRSRRVTRHATDHALASNIRGRGAVAWVDTRRFEDHGVRLRLVRRSGRLGPRTTVGQGQRVDDVDVAVGARGQVAVVWSQRIGAQRRVMARFLDRTGRRYGRPVALGWHAGLAQIDAAFSPSGRLFAAWTSQDAGAEAGRPLSVRWATVGVAARRVGRHGVLDRGDVAERPIGRLRLEATADGRAVVAYTLPAHPAAGAPPAAIVRAARASRRGRFRAPVTLAVGGALGDLAQSQSGALLAVWMRVEGHARNGIEAALKPLGRRFRATEEVARESVGLPAAGFSPATGRPTAVWSGAPGPDGPFRVRSSERTR